MTQAEMTTLINLLQGEREKTQEMADRLRKNLSSAPDGKLLVAHSNGRTQFYCRAGRSAEEDTRKRTYLSKKDSESLRLLAQKKYDEKLLFIYENNLTICNATISLLQQILDPESAILEIPASLQPYIAVPFLSAADFVKQWLASEKNK